MVLQTLVQTGARTEVSLDPILAIYLSKKTLILSQSNLAEQYSRMEKKGGLQNEKDLGLNSGFSRN